MHCIIDPMNCTNLGRVVIFGTTPCVISVEAHAVSQRPMRTHPKIHKRRMTVLRSGHPMIRCGALEHGRNKQHQPAPATARQQQWEAPLQVQVHQDNQERLVFEPRHSASRSNTQCRRRGQGASPGGRPAPCPWQPLHRARGGGACAAVAAGLVHVQHRVQGGNNNRGKQGSYREGPRSGRVHVGKGGGLARVETRVASGKGCEHQSGGGGVWCHCVS